MTMAKEQRATAVAFVPRHAFEPEGLRVARSKALEKLDGLRTDMCKTSENPLFGSCEWRVRSPSSAEKKSIAEIEDRPVFCDWKCLELSSVDFEYEDLISQCTTHNGDPLPIDEAESMVRHVLASEIVKVLDGAISIFSIPTFSSVYSSFTIGRFEDDEFYRSSGCRSSLSFTKFDKSIEFPEYLPDFNPTKLLKWSFERSGVWIGRSSTNIERSLSYFMRSFTYNLHSSNRFETLLWVVAGIEALCCDSPKGQLYQIRKRLPTLVGNYDSDKFLSMISKAYDFRSRLFHGQVNVYSPYSDAIDDRSKGDFEDGIDINAGLLAFLLNCALSDLMTQGASEVLFNESIIVS